MRKEKVGMAMRNLKWAMLALALACLGGAWTSVAPAHAGGLSWGPTPDPAPAFESEVVQTIGRFMSPSRIELFDGKLYVADTRRGHVAIYDTDGVRTGTITGVQAPLGLALNIILTEVAPDTTDKKKKKNRKNEPNLAVTQERLRIFVGDRDSGSVTVFEDGEAVGYLGSGAGEFLMPNAIAVNGGRIYVVDSKAGQVRYYNDTGQFEGAFGGPGAEPDQFGFPSDIAIDPVTGEIFVSDWRANRISVWDSYGFWLRNIAPPLNDGGEAIFLRPLGLGMDEAGNLYVVDNLLSSVTVMDQEGTLVDVFGYQLGQYHTGELRIPIDAASDGGRVYVTSNVDGRVQVFEVRP
jgi:DNA-binding beta-propeller fold protein YncE